MDNVFWIWSYLNLEKKEYSPLWGREHKQCFVEILKNKWIFNNIIWWMGDTSGDYWISYLLKENTDFFFVNPEKKVFDKYDEFKKDKINYHFIIERKDLIIEIKKEDIKYV
jgi:hypothetical protein